MIDSCNMLFFSDYYSDEVMNREQLAEELAEKRIQILVDSKLSRKDKPVTDEEDEWVSSVLLHQEKVRVEVSSHLF